MQTYFAALPARPVLGKAYLASAFFVSAIRQFKAVKYIRARQLIDDLNRAEALDADMIPGELFYLQERYDKPECMRDPRLWT